MDPAPERLPTNSIPSLRNLIHDAQTSLIAGTEVSFPSPYKPLLDKAFEGGIRKTRTFRNDELGEFPEAKGVALWNRNGLLYQAREYIGTPVFTDGVLL